MNCQIEAEKDSIWVDGDRICFNKGKAIHFIQVKDSLSFIKDSLTLVNKKIVSYEELLQNYQIAMLSADSTIEAILSEVKTLEEQKELLSSRLEGEKDVTLWQNKLEESLMLQNIEHKKEIRKLKLQRDLALGGTFALTVTTIILIVIHVI